MFDPVTEKSEERKTIAWEKTKQNHKINTASLKEDKIHKKAVHHKLKDPPFFT